MSTVKNNNDNNRKNNKNKDEESEWKCNRCTFLNKKIDFIHDNNVDFNRCRMCQGFRLCRTSTNSTTRTRCSSASRSSKRANRQQQQQQQNGGNNVVDLTSTRSSCDDRSDIAYASTTSARKRKRQRNKNRDTSNEKDESIDRSRDRIKIDLDVKLKQENQKNDNQNFISLMDDKDEDVNDGNDDDEYDSDVFEYDDLVSKCSSAMSTRRNSRNSRTSTANPNLKKLQENEPDSSSSSAARTQSKHKYIQRDSKRQIEMSTKNDEKVLLSPYKSSTKKTNVELLSMDDTIDPDNNNDSIGNDCNYDYEQTSIKKASKAKSLTSSLASLSKSKTSSTTTKVQQTLFGKPVISTNDNNKNPDSKSKKRKTNSFTPTKSDTDMDTFSSQHTNATVTKPVPTPATTTPTTTTYATSRRKHPSTKQLKQSYSQLHQKAMSILNTTFKIQSLRTLQPKAIQTALQNKSQIIILATGGGKSLCYQLPALVFDGVTIVISPLLALMIDQVNNLKAKGIEAVQISSSNTVKENDLIMKRLLGRDTSTNTSSTGSKEQQKIHKEKQIKLVYCTPESITKGRTRSILPSLYKRNMLSLIAIDEAHCLSTWGHDFRHSYRDLSYLRDSFPDIPLMVSLSLLCSFFLVVHGIIHNGFGKWKKENNSSCILCFFSQACTATATKSVIEDIREVLKLNNGEACHMSTFNRPNIHYDIRYKDAMVSIPSLKGTSKIIFLKFIVRIINNRVRLLHYKI